MLPQTRARLQASNVATSVRPDNAMHNVTQWQCRSGQKAIGENNENPPQPNHHTSCDGYEVSDILSTHPLPTPASGAQPFRSTLHNGSHEPVLCATSLGSFSLKPLNLS
ncbi:hypothetical protein VDGL01_06292 [Verticillium dahliae]